MSAANGAPLRTAMIKYCVMCLVVGSILFLGSGRLDWIRAWIYLALMFACQAGVGIMLRRLSPDLLVERSKIQKNTESWDRVLAPIIAIIGPFAMWGVAAWDMRGNWPPPVPIAWSVAAFGVCVAAMLFTGWAMATNRFFSATVRIQKDRGHVLVDSGPYRYVRHPGYSGALVFTLATPVALGSWKTLYVAVAICAVLVLRTALEDRTLRAALEGYEEFTGRTRSRLVPGLW